jgi:hypothetical protein
MRHAFLRGFSVVVLSAASAVVSSVGAQKAMPGTRPQPAPETDSSRAAADTARVANKRLANPSGAVAATVKGGALPRPRKPKKP